MFPTNHKLKDLLYEAPSCEGSHILYAKKTVFGFDKTQHVFIYPALYIAVTTRATLHGDPSKLPKVVLIRRTCDKDYF